MRVHLCLYACVCLSVDYEDMVPIYLSRVSPAGDVYI